MWRDTGAQTPNHTLKLHPTLPTQKLEAYIALLRGLCRTHSGLPCLGEGKLSPRPCACLGASADFKRARGIYSILQGNTHGTPAPIYSAFLGLYQICTHELVGACRRPEAPLSMYPRTATTTLRPTSSRAGLSQRLRTISWFSRGEATS